MDDLIVEVQKLPAGWSIYDPEMSPDFLLECPHGVVVEQDGMHYEGCESPLKGVLL